MKSKVTRPPALKITKRTATILSICLGLFFGFGFHEGGQIVGYAAASMAAPVPVIASFTATPASIQAGQSSVLSWNVSRATTLIIDNGVGNVTSRSSITVQPTQTTLYRLTATNRYGSTSAQVLVTINTTTSGGGSDSAGSSARPYVTNFTLNENPISENNNWINGKTNGLDWADVRVNQGLAFGTEVGTGGYDDSTAVLAGSWGSNQSAQATVHTVNQTSQVFEEVEIRLRTSISAHSNTGYEINFRCIADGSQYVQIVRWNGGLGSFTLLDSRSGPGIRNGDVVGASVVGSTITATINGTEIFHVSDGTYANGSPGMGFYLADYLNEVAAVRNGDFGFTSFTASDGTTSAGDTIAPSAPTNLAATGISSSQINLSWTASTDNVGVSGYRVYRNGSQVATTSATNYSNTGLAAGTTYSYSVSAYDASGNTSPLSSQASGSTLNAGDLQAPTVSISSPTNGQVLSGSVQIVANAADNVSVAGVQIYLDGVKLGTEITSAPYSMNWITTQASNASHVLTATASDSAGNTITSAGVSINVSNTASPRPYVTNFTLNQNPISENNNWINGKTNGLDWADIRVNQGLAFGTQAGTGGHDDSTAVLAGSWGSDQTAQATVHTVNQNSQVFEEVELRLRTTITPHSVTGYAIKFRCTADGTQYVQIARWNATLGNVTMIDGRTGPGLHDGDIVGASIVGSTITAFINGAEIFHVSDGTYTNGSPGMGFYLADYLNEVAAVRNGDFGFTRFTASDGATTDTTAPSTPANLAAAGKSSSQIDLSWTPSTDNVSVAGYQIFRNNVRIANTTTNGFSDVGLSANTQYTYSVTAFDAAGNVSLQSSPSTGTTFSADTTPPSAPSNLRYSNVSSNSVTISWSASTDDVGVAGYEVFRNGTKTGTTTSPSYVDTGLAPSTSYNYTVDAYDFSNNRSIQSQQLAVTTTSSTQSSPVFRQEKQNQIASGTSVSAGFSNPTNAGNTIVVYVIWSNSNSVTLTDSQGDTFVNVGSPVIWGGTNSAQVFYATGINGGADTVTAAFRDAVGSFGVIYVHEYSGISTVNPVDAMAAATGSSASMSSGSVATTSANDLIFGAGVSSNTVTSAGSSFNVRSLAFGNITEDRIAASVGSYSATATHNGTIWAMQVVAFRPAD